MWVKAGPPDIPDNESEMIFAYYHLTTDDDFDLLHIVLFYLYTDRICFTTHPDHCSLPDIPTTGDAEGIYAIADRLMEDSLMSKALHFLDSTCNAHNITSRTFGKFGRDYKDVGRVYDNFFMENWVQAQDTTEFEEFFSDLEDESLEHRTQANSKYRKMTMKMSKGLG